MKDKFKNYSFWISVTGAVLLLINNLGKIFGFNVNNEAVYSIVDGVCGVLVVFGVLTMNKSNKTKDKSEVTNAETSETIEEQKTEILIKNQDIKTDDKVKNISEDTDKQTTKTEQDMQNIDKI